MSLVADKTKDTVVLINTAVLGSNYDVLYIRYGSKEADGTINKDGGTTQLWTLSDLNDGIYYIELHTVPSVATLPTYGDAPASLFHVQADDTLYYDTGSAYEEALNLDAFTPTYTLPVFITDAARNVLSEKVVEQSSEGNCLDDCDFLLKLDAIDGLVREGAYPKAHELVLEIE
jgi:hypothetical protein